MFVGAWFMYQSKMEERRNPDKKVSLDDYMMASKSVGVIPLGQG